MLKTEEHRTGDILLIELQGDLVAGNCDDLRARLKSLITHGVTGITFDMTKTGAVDSSGIGFLAAVHNSLAKMGGSLAVTGLSDEMLQFFMNLRLHTHFPVNGRT